ncbi:uncharacterized protein B0T15DRAFT_496924 [Chaetomium strumarium]|uniref:Uncharacterized protein n=1 Tax=Chaetomium strumarium TaxID=1170767 RepID=A0AAJ0GM19_9PEZI|nr:hypothetical protein B0T15DRAFT_496924 [Chaetomium strumarium]
MVTHAISPVPSLDLHPRDGTSHALISGAQAHSLESVFTNKAIFSDPFLELAQLTFAAFHFLITYLTLLVLSRPSIALFNPRRIHLLDILPLSLAMSLNMMLPNLSLAFSAVTLYQIAHTLLNPTVAALNAPPLPHNPAAGCNVWPSSRPASSTDDDDDHTPRDHPRPFSGTLASSLYTILGRRPPTAGLHASRHYQQLLFRQALPYPCPPPRGASLVGQQPLGAGAAELRTKGQGMVGVGVAVGEIVAYSVIMLQEN